MLDGLPTAHQVTSGHSGNGQVLKRTETTIDSLTLSYSVELTMLLKGRFNFERALTYKSACAIKHNVVG